MRAGIKILGLFFIFLCVAEAQSPGFAQSPRASESGRSRERGSVKRKCESYAVPLLEEGGQGEVTLDSIRHSVANTFLRWAAAGRAYFLFYVTREHLFSAKETNYKKSSPKMKKMQKDTVLLANSSQKPRRKQRM